MSEMFLQVSCPYLAIPLTTRLQIVGHYSKHFLAQQMKVVVCSFLLEYCICPKNSNSCCL
uniref:Uncharacterized protein n=1 Tax=Octopus bimaculoides TaxID=37653 RepID=A0A0L8HWF8_OCTBM